VALPLRSRIDGEEDVSGWGRGDLKVGAAADTKSGPRGQRTGMDAGGIEPPYRWRMA